jgi:hypothetical protein
MAGEKKVINSFQIRKFGGNKISAIPPSGEQGGQVEGDKPKTSLDAILAKLNKTNQVREEAEQPEIKTENNEAQEPSPTVSKYLETLQKSGIDNDEAFSIIYNIFYGDGYYEKEYDVFGRKWTFRTMPANYEKSSAEIIETVSPKTQAMNRLLLITLTLASMVSKMDGRPIKYGDKEIGWEDADFEYRIAFVDSLPVPVRDAAYDAAGRFITLVSTVLYSEGANDFFTTRMNTNM